MIARMSYQLVTCDDCGMETRLSGDFSKKTAKEELRRQGWSCSLKTDVCPECRKRRIRGDGWDAQTGDGEETAGDPQGDISP